MPVAPAVFRPTRLLTACLLAGFAVVAKAAAIPDTPAVAAAIEARLAPGTSGRVVVRGRTLAATPLLARLYQGSGFRPQWTHPRQPDLLVGIATRTADEGLEPGDYHVSTLQELLARAAELPNDATLAADFELLLSDALVRLAYHLRFGKVDPQKLDPSWNFSRELTLENPATWLAQTIRSPELGQTLDDLRPQGPYYTGLTSALARYRAYAATGDWPLLAEGPSLKPGATDVRVRLLRQRLAAEDYPAAIGTADDDRYDEALVEVVRTYQRRNGLDDDGVLGRKSLAALNVPVAARIEQLRLNLERIRWVFRDLEREFIAVNIAAYHAAWVRDGKTVWDSRAVVGKPYRQTPVFKARMQYLVLNPTWTVPPTILRQDILPRLRQDPGYLATRGLQVIDGRGRTIDPAGIDWKTTTARNFPYLLRQGPGPDNALGRVKFMFPNPHLVYLHDTPARELFARAERSFSSGCIRIEKPIELAGLLLAGDQRWTREALDAAIAGGRTQDVRLPQEITVMLLYLTAFPGPDGQVQFREDVYKRDGALLKALNGPFVFSPPAGYRVE